MTTTRIQCGEPRRIVVLHFMRNAKNNARRAKTRNRRTFERGGFRPNYQLVKAYGITLEQYKELLNFQNNKCAICGIAASEAYRHKLFVDHCHEQGKVRGLLCQLCNSGLGYFKDNRALVEKALAYLDKGNNEKA